MQLNRVFAAVGPVCCCRRSGAVLLPLLVLLFSLLYPLAGLAQCTPASMIFKSPVLIKGTDKRVGAVYRFSNVITGVDATIEVLALTGGAGLNDIDNTSQGYNNAWQPYVTAGARDTSYLDWKIVFKKAGTSTDTVMPCLSITAVDVDGDGSSLKEFVRANTPGAQAVDPNTALTLISDGQYSEAIGPVSTVTNIDTTATRYMFQMSFSNVSTILYRNGAISTKSSTDVRHTCIYFKAFGNLYTAKVLPVQLLHLQAIVSDGGTLVQWAATDEEMLSYYAVQYSVDGVSWTTGDSVPVQAGSGMHHYSFKQAGSTSGKRFYRLRMVDRAGGSSISRMVVTGQMEANIKVQIATIVQHRMPVTLVTSEAGMFHLAIYNVQGAMIKQLAYVARTGSNQLWMELAGSTGKGLYLFSVRDKAGDIIATQRIVIP